MQSVCPSFFEGKIAWIKKIHHKFRPNIPWYCWIF